MRFNWFLLIAIVISLLIHLCFIFFLRFTPLNQKYSDSDSKPIEISVVPKEKATKRNEAPLPVEPYTPEEEPKETTLEHDLPGGQVPKNKVPKSITPSSKTKQTDNQINLPTTKNNAVDLKPKDTKNEDIQIPPKINTNKSIFDTKEITDRIAQTKPVQPEGEDTASYNVFQEKYASYFSKFRRRVYQLWEYPSKAAARGEKGTVSVTFSILKDGSVVNIKMTQSSGYPELDREVMRVLKNIGKIPLPESYKLEQLNVDEAYFIYIMGKNYGRYLE